MQQMPNLLTASGLASARSAAISLLGCDIEQACNSTVVEFQAAMLRAALALGLLSMHELHQLLPAEAWGVTLEPSCADGGVRLVLPEPVVRLNGSAPAAALFRPTLDGDAVVLNATTLAGPWQSGNRTVYVLELGPELLLPSSDKLLTLSVEEETLVAPLRGLMPRMTLSTPLANCYAPSIVSVSALPVNESGNLAQQGWDAAVRATVGLQIVFSEGVASRAEDGTLSPLDATSFHIVTPNGTEILEVRMSTSTGVRRGRRRLLDAEAYVSEAVILLGVPAAPDDDELVGLSVLEGRVVDQQGNVMAGGRVAWTNLQPGSPAGPGCPWLGGLMASALMAALSLLELSWRLLPEGRWRGLRSWWRGGTFHSSDHSAPAPAPADVAQEPAPPRPRGCREASQRHSAALPPRMLPGKLPRGMPPPVVPPGLVLLPGATRGLPPGIPPRMMMGPPPPGALLPPGMGALPLSLPPSPPSELQQLTETGARRDGRVGAAADAEATARGETKPAVDAIAANQAPKCGQLVWTACVVGCVFLLAWGSAREVTHLYTVVPFLPVWLAQCILLSAQCSRRQMGLALLPALRTLSVMVMSIAVALVTGQVTELVTGRPQLEGLPSLTDVSPLRRLMVVGPAALIAALFIALDALFSRRPCCAVKKQKVPRGAEPTKGTLESLSERERRMSTAFARAGSSRPPSSLPRPLQQAESGRNLLAAYAEAGVSPPPSPPSHLCANYSISPRQPLQPGRSPAIFQPALDAAEPWATATQKVGEPADAKAVAAATRDTSAPSHSWHGDTLHALGPEAVGSLALLVVVLMTVVGVPPYDVGDGTFSCHSIPATLVGTMAALLTPLSRGFLRCIQLLLEGLSAGQSAGLKLDPSKTEKGGDPTAAAPQTAWHRAYAGTTGKKLAEAPASSPVAAETLLRVVIAHALQAKTSIAEAASMLPATEEPATPAVWVELAAAVTEPGASASGVLGADDDLLLRRVRGVLEAADAQVVETEAMLAAIAPQLCTALLEASESPDQQATAAAAGFAAGETPSNELLANYLHLLLERLEEAAEYVGGEDGALLHLPGSVWVVVNSHFAARYGGIAAPTAAETLHILRHAADGLCGEPVEPELPPDVAAALMGEAWRRWPSEAPPGASLQLDLLHELVQGERHQGAAAALSGGAVAFRPGALESFRPAPTTELPAKLLEALETEFGRQLGARPQSTHDTVAFLDHMLETRKQAREQLLRTAATQPTPPPAKLVLAARKAYSASHGAPAPTHLAALAPFAAALPVQARALLATPLPASALREAVRSAPGTLYTTADEAGFADFTGHQAAEALEALAMRAEAAFEGSADRQSVSVGFVDTEAEAHLAAAKLAYALPSEVRNAVAAVRLWRRNEAAEAEAAAGGSAMHEAGQRWIAGSRGEPAWREELSLIRELAAEERARSEARVSSLPLSALAESCGFMPKVPGDSDEVPAEWRTSGVAGDVARLSLLREAIEEYINASQVCEEAQDETRRAALPQPVLIAAKAELAAQRKVSLQDVEVCCHLALRREGRPYARTTRAHATTVCAQVGASSDAIATFLSGLVGQYEAGAAVEELRQQAAEARDSLSNDCVASSHSTADPTPMQPDSRY